jgi:SAM-dependent methyltransferase
MSSLKDWMDFLVCPLDHSPLLPGSDAGWRCSTCDFQTTISQTQGRSIPDFRALNHPQTVQLTFQLPMQPLERDRLTQTGFRAIHQSFPHYDKQTVRRRFGTKLDKGMQFYCQQLLREFGPDARILDLGCGSDGNRRYLHDLGFRQVLTTDWQAAGADLLADAHRLPLAAQTFQMVLSTAVFEHLYNPFVAISEISRLLAPGGYLIASASFWEAWHGASCFHLTPDGWDKLLQHAGLTLEDLWPGWGILPAALNHAIAPGHLRGVGYGLQALLEGLFKLTKGEIGLRKFQLRASGSYAIFARKI